MNTASTIMRIIKEDLLFATSTTDMKNRFEERGLLVDKDRRIPDVEGGLRYLHKAGLLGRNRGKLPGFKLMWAYYLIDSPNGLGLLKNDKKAGKPLDFQKIMKKVEVAVKAGNIKTILCTIRTVYKAERITGDLHEPT